MTDKLSAARLRRMFRLAAPDAYHAMQHDDPLAFSEAMGAKDTTRWYAKELEIKLIETQNENKRLRNALTELSNANHHGGSLAMATLVIQNVRTVALDALKSKEPS